MKSWKNVLSLAVLLTFVSTLGFATKPGQTVNPNGFPSGPHYNLNLLGKKTDFNCPSSECAYMTEAGDLVTGSCFDLFQQYGVEGQTLEEFEQQYQVYGNVIFIPAFNLTDEFGNVIPIEIWMESGKKGPKSNPTATELEVTDWCAGFYMGDSATLRLPKDDLGYDVYARALASPQSDPTMTIYPEQAIFEDEYSDSLFFLGILNSDGTFESTTQDFTRTKGKSVAKDITPLFHWTGTVTKAYMGLSPIPDSCWIDDGDGLWFNTDEDGNAILDIDGNLTVDPDDIFVPTNEDGLCDTGELLEVTQYCWTDLNTNGVIDNGELTELVDGCEGNPVFTVTRSYTQEWIFNVDDFVDYLWGIDNNGLKLLQIRFYPRSSVAAQ